MKRASQYIARTPREARSFGLCEEAVTWIYSALEPLEVGSVAGIGERRFYEVYIADKEGRVSRAQ